MKKTLYFYNVYLSQDENFAKDYCIGDFSCEIEVNDNKIKGYKVSLIEKA